MLDAQSYAEGLVREWLVDRHGIDWLPSKPLPNGNLEMFPDLQELADMIGSRMVVRCNSQSECSILRIALRWYANTTNYDQMIEHPDGKYMGFIWPVNHDRGAKARAALGRCQCGNCDEVAHLSSCAVHNEPAEINGQCDCGATSERKEAGDA